MTETTQTKTPESDVETTKDAKAEAKKREAEFKALQAVVAPFGIPEAQMTMLKDLTDESPCWLTIGNWQFGPTSVGTLRKAASDHVAAPEPESKSTEHDHVDLQKKRA